MTHRADRGSVLLLGATGFIGRHVVRALVDSGYRVTCGVRDPAAVRDCAALAVDFSADHDEAVWRSRLSGVDYVVNAVGILRETRRARFDALHVAAPIALFHAAEACGVRKIVQISALGADEGARSEYHRSKKRADDALSRLGLPWVIVQPSLVFGPSGASAALFARLASLPLVPVPGDGDQRIQPVHVDDVAALVVRLLQCADFDCARVAAVGPRPTTLRDYLATLRRAMGLGTPYFVRVPMPLVKLGAALGSKFPGALLDRESLGMLLRGNTAPADTMVRALGRSPRAPEDFLDESSAHALANAARLSWLLPLVRYAVAFVWIVTGIVSFGVYPAEASYALLDRVGFTGPAAAIALYGAAALDVAFGLGCIFLTRRKWLWRAQMALIAGYTAIISWFLPEFWAHPYGPLTKNVPMLAAILMLHEFDER
jgi:uncharacterized protein YbjT (DUF2867 family)